MMVTLALSSRGAAEHDSPGWSEAEPGKDR